MKSTSQKDLCKSNEIERSISEPMCVSTVRTLSQKKKNNSKQYFAVSRTISYDIYRTELNLLEHNRTLVSSSILKKSGFSICSITELTKGLSSILFAIVELTRTIEFDKVRLGSNIERST